MVLVYSHNYAGFTASSLADYRQTSDIEVGFQKWYNVSLNNNKIGYAMTSYNKSALGYVFKDYSLLRMPMAGVLREVLLDFYAVVDHNFSIKSFTFGLASGDYSTDIFGGVKNGFLEMDIRSGGEPTHMAIPVSDGLYLPGVVPLLLASKGFPEGEFAIASLDPFAISVSQMIVTVGGLEQINTDVGKFRAHKVDIDNKGMNTTMFIIDNGTIIREVETAGMEMNLTSKEKALDIPDFNPEWDILRNLAVEADRELTNPRDAVYMRAQLEGIEPAGFDLSDDFQKLLSEKPVELELSSQPCAFKANSEDWEDLGKFLKPETFVQSDDPGIIRQSRLITKNIESDSLKALALADWVYDNVEKDYAISLPSAVEVLRVRRGDCNEHSALYTALARAAGIPTKICLGIVYSEGMFYYHAWPAVFIGGCWRPIDPTLGQHIVDATHIMLLQGGYDAQASLMRIVGKLKVKIIDYKTSTEVASIR